jgi:putative glutamine amidotransferase
MPNLATWMRAKDEQWFGRSFAPHPEIEIRNAAITSVILAEADGLLLTGGPDVAPEFLRQEIQDPSVIEKDTDSVRDAWEFQALKEALDRQLPIFAICKGMQLFNIALGGTLRLDIAGHNAPEMKDLDIQPLRTERSASHRLEKVNSTHHQAIDWVAEGCEVEAWCATDDIIEQMRLKNYPFALAVQYHPERGGDVYAPLFADFVARMKS